MERWARLAIVVLAATTASARAADVSVDPQYWTGARATSTGGVVATGSWDSSGAGFRISWNITMPTSGTYAYAYDLVSDSGGNLSKNVSRFWLQVSSALVSGDIVSATLVVGGPAQFTSSSPSTPALPGPLYAIYFDGSGATLHVQFQTARPPVWGDFYAKDGLLTNGNPVIAYNASFGQAPVTPFSGWIPRPDTAVVAIDAGVIDATVTSDATVVVDATALADATAVADGTVLPDAVAVDATAPFDAALQVADLTTSVDGSAAAADLGANLGDGAMPADLGATVVDGAKAMDTAPSPDLPASDAAIDSPDAGAMDASLAATADAASTAGAPVAGCGCVVGAKHADETPLAGVGAMALAVAWLARAALRRRSGKGE